MFLRSKLSHSKPADQTACIVPNGYLEVQTTPQNPPKNLKGRLLQGHDILSIWFEWENREVIEDLKKGRILSRSFSGEVIKEALPCIDDISSEEVFEFCRTIGVHPAHLVPFDTDFNLSLPQPLLELLTEMADKNDKFSSEDINLAEAAIAFEAKRIRKFIQSEIKRAEKEGGVYRSLAGAFRSVVGSTLNLKAIADSNYIYSDMQERGYSYAPNALELVQTLALANEDRALMEGRRSVERIRKRISLAYQEVEREYIAFFCPTATQPDTAPQEFVQGIRFQLERQRKDVKLPTVKQIEKCIRDFKKDTFFAANKKFAIECDSYIDTNGYDIGYHLNELDSEDVKDMALTVLGLFEAERQLAEAEERQEEVEGEYIARTADIDAAFATIDIHKPTMQARLLTNHLYLSARKISGDVLFAPSR